MFFIRTIQIYFLLTNDKITLKIFSITKKLKVKNYIALFLVNIENLKYHTFPKKPLVLSIICSKCKNEDENVLKE